VGAPDILKGSLNQLKGKMDEAIADENEVS